MAVLVVAEHDNTTLSPQTAKALSGALATGGDVDILVAGHECRAVAEMAARLRGARKVLLADEACFAHQLAEPMARLIVSLAERYDILVAPATSSGKNVMPRVAALLDVMQVSEVIDVIGPDVFKRSVYAGNAIETVQSLDGKVVLTLHTPSFPAAQEGSGAEIEVLGSSHVEMGRSYFIERQVARSDRPDLSTARIVVSGGRAFGSKDRFDALLQPLADKLGAAIGASRAAVDAGFTSNDLQVGQTGKSIAPDLYIACGISGAIQHLAGMQGAKVIVAINKDAEAPIFQVADYGLVGDIFDILPEFVKAL